MTSRNIISRFYLCQQEREHVQQKHNQQELVFNKFQHAPKWSTMIHFRLPERRSTCLTPPTLVATVDKADEMILQATLQISLTEHKSREEQEARENVELVNKHLASEEIEKMMEGSENVIDDSLPPRNDEPHIPGTRLEPRSDKESPEVESTDTLDNIY
ncbi:hypothetical protein Tco_0356275 [Tanacetum coccineum]